MAASEKIHVLHVDDDPDTLAVTGRYLEEHDALVVETEADPVAGLQQVQSFDCVVLDYKMDAMDGLEFLREVRRDHDVPVIFFTGMGSEEIASEAIAAGVTDYLRKSANTEQYDILANRIEYLVGKQRAENAAAAAETRVRRVYERITVPFFAVDDDWQFTYLNDNAESLFEMDETAILGRSLWEQFPALCESATEHCLRGAAADEEFAVCAAELHSVDRHVDLHVYSDDTGLSVFVDDLTEAREREAELESLREELEMTESQFRVLREKLSRPASAFR